MCSKRPHIFQSDDDRLEFTEFIEKLSNATFENYDQLPMKRTFDIDSNQYLELLWNLSFGFKPELNSGSTHKLYLQDTITELGLCYAINSKVAVYNSYRWSCMRCLCVCVCGMGLVLIGWSVSHKCSFEYAQCYCVFSRLFIDYVFFFSGAFHKCISIIYFRPKNWIIIINMQSLALTLAAQMNR